MCWMFFFPKCLVVEDLWKMFRFNNKDMSFAKDFSLGLLLPKIKKNMMISSWYLIRDTEKT